MTEENTAPEEAEDLIESLSDFLFKELPEEHQTEANRELLKVLVTKILVNYTAPELMEYVEAAQTITENIDLSHYEGNL